MRFFEKTRTGKRLKVFDVAKGIGIVAVMLGHMYDKYFDYNWFHILQRVIYSFHMPLFFLIAGFFLYHKSGVYNIKNRIKTLLLPYFFVGTLKVLIGIIHDYLKKISFSSAVNMALTGDWENFTETALGSAWGVLYGVGETRTNSLFYINSVGPLWFLPALLISTIIVIKICNCDKLRNKMVSISIVFIAMAGWLSAEIWEFRAPFSLQASMVAALYVYIGYCISQKAWLYKCELKAKWILRLIMGGGGCHMDDLIIISIPTENVHDRVSVWAN